jgi:hypothetical protein
MPKNIQVTAINWTGDWTNPESGIWFMVAIPNVGKRVYCIAELRFLELDRASDGTHWGVCHIALQSR